MDTIYGILSDKMTLRILDALCARFSIKIIMRSEGEMINMIESWALICTSWDLFESQFREFYFKKCFIILLLMQLLKTYIISILYRKI